MITKIFNDEQRALIENPDQKYYADVVAELLNSEIRLQHYAEVIKQIEKLVADEEYEDAFERIRETQNELDHIPGEPNYHWDFQVRLELERIQSWIEMELFLEDDETIASNPKA